MKGPFSVWVFGVTLWIDLITVFLYKFKRKKKMVLRKSVPAVSVIIPAHKEFPENVVLTIKSLYAEGHPLKNVIVCGDGNAAEKNVIETLRKIYPNLMYIESKERSKAKKINFVAQKYPNMLGEYVYVRDCKVLSENNCVQRMVAQFTEDDIVAVTSYGYLKKPKNFLARSYFYGKDWVNELGRFRKRAQEKRNAMFVVCGASTMYRTSVLRKFPIPNKSKTEDTHYTWFLQMQGMKVRVADDAVVYAPDVDGKWGKGIRNQLKQAYRWNAGTVQCFFLEWRNIGKNKKLAYTTIIPGFIEAIVYSIALVMFPVLFWIHPYLLIGFLVGDLFFSLLGTLIFARKKFWSTLFHYPQILFFKYLNALVFMIALVRVTYQRMRKQTGKWSNEWTPVG